MAGKTIGDVALFILFVFLSRAFGQEGIGLYSLAMALTGFFAVVGDFGLNPYAIKELSRKDTALAERSSQILSLMIVLLIAALGALLLVLPLLRYPLDFKLIFVVIGTYQLTRVMAEGLATIFIAQEDAHLAGVIEVSFKVVSAGGAIAVGVLGGSLVLAITVLPVVTLGQVFGTYWVASKKYGSPRLILSRQSLWQVMREASPYAFSRFLLQLYTRADVVMLGFLISTVAAGIYNVAYRVIFLLSFLPHFAASAVFPQASRLYATSNMEFKALYQNSLNLIILLGLPIGGGLWVIAPDLITLLFGDAFEGSVVVLRLLSVLVPLLFLSRMMGVFLMSCNRQVDRTKFYVIVATFNVVGNLALIPVWGVAGAALVALVSEAILVTLFATRLRDVVGWPRVNSRHLLGIVGVASFLLPFTLLPSLSMGVVIPASAILYAAVLLSSKQTRQNEGRMLMNLLKRGRS